MIQELVTTDLSKLFRKQHELDAGIIVQHDLYDVDLKQMRRLALFDELAELLNKTKCHKFWSEKQASDREALEKNGADFEDLLEEYVDGWHFLLSIGNDLEVPEIHHGIDIQKDFNAQFDNLLSVISIVCSEVGWLLYVNLYKGLATHYGFTWEQILVAYDKKYEINLERQRNHY
ncbi:putative dUTPase [Bacillus phage vB_BceS-M2]